jgi:surfeit locus 1 family protein
MSASFPGVTGLPAATRAGLRRRRSVAAIVLLALLATAFAGFVALGVWQLQRMAWKQALIARVDARIHAAPVAPPPRTAWAGVSEERDGYRRIRLAGTFLPVAEARTQAVTDFGMGAWSLAPLRTDSGDIVFVNRGFVPQDRRAVPLPSGRVEIVGLLRPSEPGGGFLRRNVPGEDRWHSRDVAAIARTRGLPATSVAPFFVDAEADRPDGWPRGGLTVVHFRDAHFGYALTWFGLAVLTAFAGARLLVSRRRMRQDDR